MTNPELPLPRPNQHEHGEVVRVEDLLLPREQYSEAEERYPRGSITLEIQNDTQELFYFGANHSKNPENPQYAALKEYWERFLKATEGKERIVLVEGELRKLYTDENAAISSGAEGNLVTLLAHQANILVACPDLDEEALVERLPDLDRNHVLLYEFLAWVTGFQRNLNQEMSLMESVQTWAERESQREIWKSLDVSVAKLMELHRQILGKDFDENENTNDLINPNLTTTPINIIARALSDQRDLNIASELVRYWREGKSIFSTFGRGHLIIEEPALRKLLT